MSRRDTIEIVELVIAERERQNVKWGEQNHDNHTWLTILTEEVGECAEAALRTTFGRTPARALRAENDLACELVQVAAVAVAIVECIRRRRKQVAS